jgi:hypothetical protein
VGEAGQTWPGVRAGLPTQALAEHEFWHWSRGLIRVGHGLRRLLPQRVGHEREPLTLQGAMPWETDLNQTLCADNNGFSLHAAVRCAADDRHALEQLCRYISRPALANERVQTNAAGQVVLKLKTPGRDGTTHLVMSPLEFMLRPAASVPRPRLHPPMTASQPSISAVGCPVWVASCPPA